MYKKESAVILATIMFTALFASLSTVAAAAPAESVSPSEVGGGQWVILTFTVKNDGYANEVARVRFKNTNWSHPMGGHSSTAPVADNWENMADNISAAADELIYVADNLREALENKKTAGIELGFAAENLETAGSTMNNTTRENALDAGYAIDKAAEDLAEAASLLQEEPENLVLIAKWIENAAGTGNLTENLENAAQYLLGDSSSELDQAGDNLSDAADNLASAATYLKGGMPWLAGDYLDNAADNIENAGINLQNYTGTGASYINDAGDILKNNVAPKLRATATALKDMATNLEEAGTKLSTIRTTYFDNALTLDMDNESDNTINYLSSAFSSAIEGAENALIGRGDWSRENILAAGENLTNAALALEASMGGENKLNFGSKYLGYNSDAADNLLESAGDNLNDGERLNITVAASNIENMASKLTSAANKLSSTASELSPSNWALDYQNNPGAGRAEFIAENYEYQIADGSTKDFTFLWLSPSPGTTQSYTFDVWVYDNTGAQLDHNTVSVSVDDEAPSASVKKVTQSGVSVENVVGATYNDGKATITITASEELDNLNTAWIENASGDNKLPSISMSDWTTTDSTTFTYEFDVAEAFADENDNLMQVRIESPWATDVSNNENNNELTVSFYVDTTAPVLLDNGLKSTGGGLRASMTQKVQAGSGNTYWVDNQSTENVTCNVEDNWAAGTRFAYDNYDNDVITSVEVDWDGTVDAADVMDDPENGWTLTKSLADGIYSMIKVTATDWTGNSTSDNVENILIDTTSPSASFDTIAGVTWDENKKLINDNTPTVSLTISDAGLGVAYENLEVQLDNDDNYLNGTPFWTLENMDAYEWNATTGQATWENTIDNMNAPASDRPLGLRDSSLMSNLKGDSYWITLKAGDNLWHDGENYAYFAQSFKVDATSPSDTTRYLNRTGVTVTEADGTVVVAAGGATSTGVTDKSTLTVAGTSVESGSTIKIYVKENSPTYTEVGSTTLPSGETDWEATITGLSEGTNELYLEETDLAGNVSNKVLFAKITVDLTAPTIELSSDTAALDGTSTGDSSVTISATITDNVVDYKDIYVAVRATAYDRPETQVTLSADNTITWSVPLQEGSNTIDVVAQDSVNNTSIESITVTRTVTPWTMYAVIGAIIAIILAAIAIIRRSS